MIFKASVLKNVYAVSFQHIVSQQTLKARVQINYTTRVLILQLYVAIRILNLQVEYGVKKTTPFNSLIKGRI